eukprot:COSAG06_NODE_5138_length_3687_cov_4.373467_3_plen_168_part_00
MAQKCRFSQRLASLEANSGGGGGLLTPCLVGGSALGSCYAMGFVPFPEYFIGNAMIFVLASVLGYCLCANVKPSLHTPLMSMSNAISGIVIIGGMYQARKRHFFRHLYIKCIILPRQARDKHRENSKNDRFLVIIGGMYQIQGDFLWGGAGLKDQAKLEAAMITKGV